MGVVRSPDITLKRNSAAILGLLCLDDDVRKTTGPQAMKLLAALMEVDMEDESARQYCADAMHALARDKTTLPLLVSSNIIFLLLSLARQSDSSHTDILCTRTLYMLSADKESLETIAIDASLLPLLEILTGAAHDNESAALLIAIIRSVSWCRAALDTLVTSGITRLLATLVDHVLGSQGDDSPALTMASRLDCAVSCRNFAHFQDGEQAEARHSAMTRDAVLDDLFHRICVGKADNMEMRRYEAQTMCYLATSPVSRDSMNRKRVIQRIKTMVHSGAGA